MRTAIIFDDLIQDGGAEKLLSVVSETFPTAEIYTSVASDHWLSYFKNKNVTVVTTFMQKLPFKLNLNRFYGLFGLHSLAFSRLNLREYELVLSISSRFAHHVVTPPEVLHVCYINSPGRMFWEPSSYFHSEGIFNKPVLGKIAFFLTSFPLSFVRLVDYASAQRVDFFIANSITPARRVKKYYKRDCEIVYPFVTADIKNHYQKQHPEEYFLVITRLVSWKRVDIAVDWATKYNKPLIIVGTGSELDALQRRAGNSVKFVGRVSDQQKFSLISSCKAVIVTQKEDFGIVQLEALSCGKPVIAYGAGGSLETIKDGKNGILFGAQTVESLNIAVERFKYHRFSISALKASVQKYTKELFQNELTTVVQNCVRKFNLMYN